MKFGPIEIAFSDRRGVWLTKPGGTPQDVTVPAIVIAVAVLLVFCCCARVVF